MVPLVLPPLLLSRTHPSPTKTKHELHPLCHLTLSTQNTPETAPGTSRCNHQTEQRTPIFHTRNFHTNLASKTSTAWKTPQNKQWTGLPLLQQKISELTNPKTSREITKVIQKMTNIVRKKDDITVKTIINLKKTLHPNTVVAIKDKNNGQLFAECPVAYYARIQKEILNCPSLTHSHLSHTQALAEIKTAYDRLNLKRFGPFRKGTLPYMYLIPKEKDPPKKSRLISSYSAHPLRTVYKRTSAILTWCFSEISDYKHFTLYKLSDIKKRTKAACRWFRRLGPSTDLLTIQTDVKQMYTNLKHNEILSAINWLLDKVLSNLNKERGTSNSF